MLNAVVVAILVGLAALVASLVVLLIPAVILARFLRQGPTEPAIVRPAGREIGARAAYARPR